MDMASGFLTVVLASTGTVPGALVGIAPPAPVTLVAQPAPRQLVGWKEIVPVSVANGGPSTERALRMIVARCNARRQWHPFWRAEDGGPVTCLDVELVQWLRLRRKPLGLAKLGSRSAAEKKTKGKAPKKGR